MGRLYDSGYDKGPAWAKRISLDTTNFDNNLDETDTDVQTAMETIDELVTGGGVASDVTVVTTSFDNNLSAADDDVQKALDTIDNLTGFKTVTNEQITDYTLVLTDAYKLIEMNKTTAVTLTVPKNSVVAFPIGTTIGVIQKGAGTVTISPVDVDVTILSLDAAADIIGQYAGATLTKVAVNTWYLTGAIE